MQCARSARLDPHIHSNAEIRGRAAKSEKIVPGPHGACKMPETLDELRRILHLHLKSN